MPGAYVWFLSIVLCRQFFKWSSDSVCSSWLFLFPFQFEVPRTSVYASVVAPHIVTYAPSCPRTTFGNGLDPSLYHIYSFFLCLQKFRAIRSPVVRVEQHSYFQVFFCFFHLPKSPTLALLRCLRRTCVSSAVINFLSERLEATGGSI